MLRKKFGKPQQKKQIKKIQTNQKIQKLSQTLISKPQPKIQTGKVIQKNIGSKQQQSDRKRYNQIKKLVGQRYRDELIIRKIKQYPNYSCQEIINECSKGDLDKGDKNALLFKKVGVVQKEKQKRMVQYEPRLKILKKCEINSPKVKIQKVCIQKLMDITKYIHNFKAQEYI